jgi:hypothetical protein
LIFAKERTQDNAITTANHDNNQSPDSLLEPVDILIVDSKSRITFTNKLKKILSVSPGDKLIVYQNRQDKNLTFKLQRKDNVIVDLWTLSYNYGCKDDLSNYIHVVYERLKRRFK